MGAAGQLLPQDLHIVVGAEAQASFVKEGQAGGVERQRLSELRSEAAAPNPSHDKLASCKGCRVRHAAASTTSPAQAGAPQQGSATRPLSQQGSADDPYKAQGGAHQLHCADDLTRRVVGADGVRHVAASAVCAAGGRPQVRRRAGTRRSAASACRRKDVQLVHARPQWASSRTFRLWEAGGSAECCRLRLTAQQAAPARVSQSVCWAIWPRYERCTWPRRLIQGAAYRQTRLFQHGPACMAAKHRLAGGQVRKLEHVVDYMTRRSASKHLPELVKEMGQGDTSSFQH